MARKARIIKRRKRIFLGCEGKSEQSYAALLTSLIEEFRNDIYIDATFLKPGGGDPLTLIERAKRILQRKEKFHSRWILLDSDRRYDDRVRLQAAEKIADDFNVRFIWQEPCHEGLLLRHFKSKERPSSTNEALQKLRIVWPSYEKGMASPRLGDKIRYSDVVKASKVESDLKSFLDDIGFFSRVKVL